MTALLILVGFVFTILLAGIVYQALGSAKDARAFPPPGEFVDVGGHRLHVHVSGAGSPTVVFESGIAASSINWQLVRSEVVKFARVCSYDRAGLGWSEAAHDARSLPNALRDLRALLTQASLPGPFILVGHSFGGMLALEYACAHRGDLAGLVLVDPLTAGEWCPVPPGEAAKLRRGVQLARRGALLARLGVVRLSLDLLRAGSRRIPQLASRLSSGNGSKLTERLVGEVRKLPPELWPVIQAHWCQPKSFLSMASHLESLPASAAACHSNCELGDLPMVVLSAADATPARFEEHARMAARSSRGTRIVAEKSGHWIQLDEPELVVEAIRRIVNIAARSTSFPTQVCCGDDDPADRRTKS